MKIEMKAYHAIDEARGHDESWDVALVGPQMDERSSESVAFSKSKCDRVVEVEYDPSNLLFRAGGEAYYCYQLPDFIKLLSAKKILLDATSLGVPELGLLLKNIRGRKKIKSAIVYFEPGQYAVSKAEDLNGRSFNLSTEFFGYKGIPTLTKSLGFEQQQCVVFFLGFEGSRLGMALEDLNIRPEDCSLIFGVPSYKTGWEMNAYENNIRSINENDLDGRVYFCGADNPAAVISELVQIRKLAGEEQSITLVPIGSKPHSIGALAFFAWDKNASIVYDHPAKAAKRSDSIGSIHIYKLIA